MKATYKWHKGLAKMVSKKDFPLVARRMSGEFDALYARKSHFMNLARNADKVCFRNWRHAAAVATKADSITLDYIKDGGVVALSKDTLRRIASV